MVAWYEEVRAETWPAALHRQRRMVEFMAATSILEADGNDHGPVGKAVAAASDFLVPCVRTRPPYRPVADEAIARFRRIVEERFGDLAWAG